MAVGLVYLSVRPFACLSVSPSDGLSVKFPVCDYANL